MKPFSEILEVILVLILIVYGAILLGTGKPVEGFTLLGIVSIRARLEK